MTLRVGLLAFFALAAPATAISAQETTNFSMVGFEIDLSNAASYHASISEVIAQCELIELDSENSACMQEKDNGGQIWVGMRQDDGEITIITANPAFVGKSRFPVTVEARVSDKAWEPFEYQLAVQFSDLDIPLIVELADPRDAAAFPAGGPSRSALLDLTAFGFAPKIFPSAEDFLEAERNAEIQRASDFFIPTGLYGDTARARASFAGEVIEAELMTTQDGKSHWRTLVKVLGEGTINVVFDDKAVEVAPVPGNVIAGDYWLSARVISE